MMIDITIVIPVYNEEEILPVLIERLNTVILGLKKMLSAKKAEEREIEVLFVNDGSIDGTLRLLKLATVQNKYYRYISLSRNFGHHAAVSAGINCARGNFIVVMDGDLQDPPELIAEMLKKSEDGFDVVYAVKRKRKANFLKNIAYKAYYRLNSLISEQPVQRDSGDFCLLNRKVADIIKDFPEKETYFRGLRSWVGFKQTAIFFDRPERKIGKSKYSYRSLFKLAFRGILSTSTKPLLISGFFSVISLLLILGLMAYALLAKIIFQQDAPRGWASLMMTISVLSAFQLFSLWLLSLYTAKIYREVLSRPKYLIAEDSLKDDNRKS